MASTIYNLRATVEEWKNRLQRANYDQFGNQLRYLFNNFNSTPQIAGILQELKHKFPYEEAQLDGDIKRSLIIPFTSYEHEASYKYQFLVHFIEKTGSWDIQENNFFRYGRGTENEILSGILENHLRPIFYAIEDELNMSSSILYLLEKYKKRTEWFTRERLANQYEKATKIYEQIFEDDLRLFLFDQGVEYPFSTPSSTSGRADLVGQLETNDPLVVEIKFFDRTRKYGKNKIQGGFKQIIKYANDYNKSIGYLVIYNLDKAELNLKFSEETKTFPPRIIFNGKTFYFVVINILVTETASKGGKIEVIEITEGELTKNLD